MSLERKDTFELKSVERLVEDIFDRRERKILNMAIISARTSIPPENLTDEEKIFFNAILANIKGRRESTLKNFFAARITPEVVFKEDMPAFVAIDEKTYGPFKKGDTTRLPEENARVLLQRGVAEEVK
jgi:DNA replication initiation complex subunit (GINS family)